MISGLYHKLCIYADHDEPLNQVLIVRRLVFLVKLAAKAWACLMKKTRK